MRTLVDDIRDTSGINQTQAEIALGVVLEYFAASLPSPIMGRIREALQSNSTAQHVETPKLELSNAAR